jgi:hypothetical protein
MKQGIVQDRVPTFSLPSMGLEMPAGTQTRLMCQSNMTVCPFIEPLTMLTTAMHYAAQGSKHLRITSVSAHTRLQGLCRQVQLVRRQAAVR